MQQIERQVAEILVSVLGKDRGGLAIESRDIISDGLLDSFGIIEVSSHIEEIFDVIIPVEDLNAEAFASVGSLAKLVSGLLP